MALSCNVRSAFVVASLSVGASVGALGACDHDAPPSAIPANATTARMGSTELQPTATAAGAAPTYGPQSPMIPGAGAQADFSNLGDGQLAGIVQAIHAADIEHLQVALARSSSSEVQSFARDAIAVLRAAAIQDLGDLARLKITPTVSSASEEVLADWQRDRMAIQAAPAVDFDRTFIDHHAQLDEKAVALLDATIANVRSSALKGYLQTDRASVAGHMRESQRLQLTSRSQP